MYDRIAKEDTKKASTPKPAVQVHYNSPRPAQLHADAYTHGNQIYLGAGQEDCLPHELGHVLQQQQRSVPITEKRNGVGVNTDAHLEREADRLGAGIGSQAGLNMQASSDTNASAAPLPASSSAPVQMKMSLPWRKKAPKKPILPGQIITENSSDADRARMEIFAGGRVSGGSNAYTQTPIPAAPAAAPAATSRQSILESFRQTFSYWQANRKMPTLVNNARQRRAVPKLAKPSLGSRFKKLFSGFGKK